MKREYLLNSNKLKAFKKGKIVLRCNSNDDIILLTRILQVTGSTAIKGHPVKGTYYRWVENEIYSRYSIEYPKNRVPRRAIIMTPSEFLLTKEKHRDGLKSTLNHKVKDIDRVTIDRLDTILTFMNISLPREVIDVIIDAIELIEEKGDKVDLNDLSTLKSNHSLDISKRKVSVQKVL